MNVDDEWEQFLEGGDDIVSEDTNENISCSPTEAALFKQTVTERKIKCKLKVLA